MNGGRIEQVGTPEDLVHRPATDFIQDLFSKPKEQLEFFQGLEEHSKVAPSLPK